MNRSQTSERGEPYTVEEASLLADKECALGHFQAALDIYHGIIARMPGHAVAHNNCANILQKMRRYDEALASYDTAIALKPDYSEAYINRGAALQHLRRYEDALFSYDKAIALQPGFAEAHSNRGTTLYEMKRYDEALASYAQAIALKPGFVEAYVYQANTLASKGRMQEAEAMYLKALALRPDFATPLFNLVNIRKYKDVNHPDAKNIRRLLEKKDVPPSGQDYLYFALGKIYDDCGRWDDAFECYRRANQLRSIAAPYHADEVSGMTSAIMDVFSQDFLSRTPAFASDDSSPVFVVGMPRSGTTLAASVLSSHPSIGSAGELAAITDFTQRLPELTKTGEVYPQAVKHITPAIASGLIHEYVHCLRRNVGTEVPYVIDKQPFNFRHLGFIAMLFPGARIIHCTRHPQGTALSNYFQRFSPAYNYSFDLEHIRHFYGEYVRLMAHWRKVLPLQMLDVSYEDMVMNTGQTARRMLDFLGLEWDERCLSPHNNPHAVETASQWQVRQPIHTQSVERWRHYEKHLAVPVKDTISRSQLLSQALALHKAGKLGDAEALYRKALAESPNDSYTLRELGTLYLQRGHYAEGIRLIEASLKINPAQPEAYNNLGNALRELKNYDAALVYCEKAVALRADYADAHNNRGATLLDMGRYGEALASFNKTIALKPDHIDAHRNRGHALRKLARHAEALVSYDKAIALKPGDAEAHMSRGGLLQEMKRYDEALASYDKATLLKAGYADAWYNRGIIRQELRQFDRALADYAQAIACKPDYAAAYNNRGTTLHTMKRYDEALASFDKAIALKADYADAYNNRGVILFEMKRYEDALANYDQAMTLNPDFPYLPGKLLHTRMHLCYWQDAGAIIDRLEEGITAGEPVVTPFIAVNHLSLSLQKKCAEIYVAKDFPPSATPLWSGEVYGHEKIRVGYFSADFHAHPMAYLMAGLFEVHDRSRFEIIGFSLDAHPVDDMRKRLEKGFDRFIDVRNKTDGDVAALARSMEIDIAVDLNGFTRDARAGIFALRPAPVQVSYMGYPGTMGASYIDYIVADAMLIPEEDKGCYSEKIVTLPHSYQVNDSSRQISDTKFARAEMGLPEEGFVFCCFNNSYKITPEVFDIWMRLLKKVERSVLWLSGVKSGAAENLYAEAEKRGIEKHRLVFAGRMPDIADHLARYRLADVFLDTFHYNAHATASDALWAGLPVVTCVGKTFAARVAASLLNAVGLPELITHSHKEYEALALELAGDPKRLAAIKEKLAQNRSVYPLFDTALFAGHIEDAYVAMWEKTQAGLPAEHIYVRGVV